MRLSGWALPFDHLSATSLAEAISCPEQFRQKRLLKRPDRMYLDRFIGSVFHRTVETNLKQKIETSTDNGIREQLVEMGYAWQEIVDKEGEPEWKDATPEETLELLAQMLTNFTSEASPQINPASVEEWFEVRVPGVPVPVIGRTDIRETSRILDLKTAGKKISKPKTKWRLQGRIYQLADPKTVEWVVITKQKTPMIYTAANEPQLGMPVGNQDVTVQTIAQTAEIINDLYARYGADHPWPTHGLMHEWLCSYCNYIKWCPAWRTEDHDPLTA
jgi:hypothetical protein